MVVFTEPRPQTVLADVLELSDPVGVLSIYVDADPTLGGGPRPAWQTPVLQGLRTLVADARREWPRAERATLEARLEELEPELEALLDPRGGRGRALFAEISGPAAVAVSLRTPVETRVTAGATARALPLAAALQAERPAGVVSVTRGGLELSEWRPGELEPLETVELDVEPARDPAGRTNPAVRQPSPERDRFERVLDARLAGAVRASRDRLDALAAERGWDAVVVDGEPRLVSELVADRSEGPWELVRSERALGGVAPEEAAERAGAAIRDVRRRRTQELGALLATSPLAAHGVQPVATALAQSRVDLLLVEERAGRGAEALLREAAATGAETTVVAPDEGPVHATGVAALLRW